MDGPWYFYFFLHIANFSKLLSFHKSVHKSVLPNYFKIGSEDESKKELLWGLLSGELEPYGEELQSATRTHLGRVVRYIRKTGAELTKLAAEPGKRLVRKEGGKSPRLNLKLKTGNLNLNLNWNLNRHLNLSMNINLKNHFMLFKQCLGWGGWACWYYLSCCPWGRGSRKCHSYKQT